MMYDIDEIRMDGLRSSVNGDPDQDAFLDVLEAPPETRARLRSRSHSVHHIASFRGRIESFGRSKEELLPWGPDDQNLRQLSVAAVFRVLLPLVLAVTFISRVNLFSFIYLLFFLWHPFVPSTGRNRLQPVTVAFILAIAFCSSTFLVAQIVFVSVSSSSDLWQQEFQCNSTFQGLLHQIGFPDFGQPRDWTIYVICFGPEALILMSAFCLYLGHRFSLPLGMNLQRRGSDDSFDESLSAQRRSENREFLRKLRYILAWSITVLCIALLIATACCLPSLISLFYLLLFFTVGTLWSFNTDLGAIVHRFTASVAVVAGLNILILYLAQFHFIDQDLSDSGLAKRDKWMSLTGIVSYVQHDCDHNGTYPEMTTRLIHGYSPSIYLYPALLLALYFFMAHHAFLWTKYNKPEPVVAPKQRAKSITRRVSRRILPMYKPNMYTSRIQSLISSAYKSVKKTLTRQAYLGSVVILIFWSVWCHGVIALVMLFLAVYLWSRKNSRPRALGTAPFLCLFCPLYIFVQFIMNFSYFEIQSRSIDLQIGNLTRVLDFSDLCVTSKLPMIEYLGLQCVFMITFWALMREYIKWQEVAIEPRDHEEFLILNSASFDSDIEESEEGGGGLSRVSMGRSLASVTLMDVKTTINSSRRKIKQMASAVWMGLCLFVLLYVSTQGFPNAIKIVYMSFFIVFVGYTVFALADNSAVPNFERFLRCILAFTMFVLCLTYIIQLPFLFGNGFSKYEGILSEFGLLIGGISSTWTLLPTALLLIVIKIQFDYFSRAFNEFILTFSGEDLSNLNTETMDSHSNVLKFVAYKTKEFTLFIITIHFDQILLLAVVGVLVAEVTAINFVFLCVLIFCCTANTRTHKFLFLLLFVMSCFVVLTKMIYQNSLVQSGFDSIGFNNTDCDDVVGENSTYRNNFLWTNSTMEWIGYKSYSKNVHHDSYEYVWRYLTVMILSFVWVLLKTRIYARKKRLETKRDRTENEVLRQFCKKRIRELDFICKYRAIFPKIDRWNAEKGIRNMMRYIANFVLYKFGLEVCTTVVLVNCINSLNMYSALYIVLLMPMVSIRRKYLRMYMKLFTYMTALCLLVQYGLLLWIPPLPFLCDLPLLVNFEYPPPHNHTENSPYRYFMFLPSFSKQYDLAPTMLFGTFFQLIFFRAFLRSLKEGDERHQFNFCGVAGNNKECLHEPDRHRPLTLDRNAIVDRFDYTKFDFIHDKKDPLNVLKSVVMTYGIWFTYFFICLTGLQRVDIFGFGFIGFAFLLLWKGSDIALEKRSTIERYFRILLIYALFSTLVKVLLQLTAYDCSNASSVFNEGFPKMLLELLNVLLLESFQSRFDLNVQNCDYVSLVDSMISWESACVVIVLLQRRIFLSHYYDYVMEDAVITRDLAVEGAVLIRAYNKKDIRRAIALREKLKSDLCNAIKSIKNRISQSRNWREPVNHLDAIFNGDRFFEDSMLISDHHEALEHLLATEDIASHLRVFEGVDSKWGYNLEALKSVTIGEDANRSDRSQTNENDVTLADDDSSSDDSGDYNHDVDSEESSVGVVSWVLTRVTYVLFFGLGKLALVLDRASASFQRVVIKLDDIRAEKMLENAREAGRTRSMAPTHSRRSVVSRIALSHSFISDSSRASTNTEESRSNTYRFFLLFIRDFLLSLYNYCVSQTDYLCYFMILMLFVFNGSTLDMTLLILSLLWGLLSKPRPSKRFWSMCIVYNGCTILLRYALQSKIFRFNHDGGGVPSFWLLLIVGDMDSNSKTKYISQLILIILLCFHRNILMNFGLWTEYRTRKAEQRASSMRSASSSTIGADEAIEQKIQEFSESNHAEESSPLDISESGVFANGNENQSNSEFSISDDSSFSSDSDLFSMPMRACSSVRDFGFDIYSFFRELLDSNKTAIVDVYTPMIMVDMLSYIVVIAGYSGFSNNDRGLLAQLANNEVPVQFLVIMMVFFGYTLVDRVSYLTKNASLKLLSFVSQVIVYNVYLVIINPLFITHKLISHNSSLQLLYIIRWVYWILSAYQIKVSFPVRVLGNCFGKKYNNFNKICMLIYFNAPFLFEIRVLMDWLFTDTTLTFFRWLEVEDAFVTTFLIKCTREIEKGYNYKRGQLMKKVADKSPYFLLFLLLIFIIWGPLLLFSFLNTTKVPAPVTYANMRIELGQFLSIYDGSNLDIEEVSYAQLLGNPSYTEVVRPYDPNSYDFNNITFDGQSESVWTITPPARERLIFTLANMNRTDEFLLYVRMQFSRLAVNSSSAVTGYQSRAIGEVTKALTDQERCQLVSVLCNSKVESGLCAALCNGTFCLDGMCKIQNYATLESIIPVFFTVSNTGFATAAENSQLVSVNATLHPHLDGQNSSSIQWWTLEQGDEDQFTLYTINEQVVPDLFSSVASYGIIGLYTVFVFLVATELKSLLGGYSYRIIFYEIPDVTPIQNIALEMYLCREMKHFELEEDLYSQIQYLYRSPETMVKNTRFKVD